MNNCKIYEWKKTSEELPKIKTRCLGYCSNGKYEECKWSGYVDVFFDPQIGWLRCETKKEESVCVLYWIEHPGRPLYEEKEVENA